MRKLVTAAFLSLLALAISAAGANAETLTPKQAADLFAKSVVKLTGDYGDQANCTAAKIGEALYLSAGHCASLMLNGKVRTREGYDWVKARSITVTTQTKTDRTRHEDWLLINTAGDLDNVEALTLGCEDELYIGMPIAYAGFPAPIDYGMGLGHIMSVKATVGSRNNLDFIVDVHAAPGASGSPVINLETGNVIGILTEGVPSRVGFFAVGIEHIRGLDICEDWLADKEQADESKPAPVLGNTDELSSPY